MKVVQRVISVLQVKRMLRRVKRIIQEIELIYQKRRLLFTFEAVKG